MVDQNVFWWVYAIATTFADFNDAIRKGWFFKEPIMFISANLFAWACLYLLYDFYSERNAKRYLNNFKAVNI